MTDFVRLAEEGWDLFGVLEHLLERAPPGDLVPSECSVGQSRERVYLLAPDGSAWGHIGGGAVRLRDLPDRSCEVVFFVRGEVTRRVVLSA